MTVSSALIDATRLRSDACLSEAFTNHFRRDRQRWLFISCQKYDYISDGVISMQPLAEQILVYAATLPEGTAFRAKELLHLGTRAGIDQALARLERCSSIARISRGLYFRQVSGRYGSRTAPPSKVLTSLANATGETIAEHGAAAANAFGLTTQIPVRSIYLTSGRTRTVNVGGHSVELRHAREWELLLPNQAAGDALRVLSWAGKPRAKETISALKGKLALEDQQNLLNLRGRLPTWVAQEVSSFARG